MCIPSQITCNCYSKVFNAFGGIVFYKHQLLFLNPLMYMYWFMFGVIIDTGPKFYAVPSAPPYMTLRSRSGTLNFFLKVFRTSLFPNPVMYMYLVHVWYNNDRYWSKFLLSTIPPLYMTFKLKVRNKVLHVRFCNVIFLHNLWWIWFMFCMVIDTGSKLYMVPSPSQDRTLRSRSQT